jgi:NADPH:quinone reductase-like Zn-dependent oxidoreductase
MRAWRIHAYGGIEQLQLETVPLPSPGKGELLVKVGAASVNPVDWRMLAGQVRGAITIEFPRILGRDCAGAVMESRSNAFQAGERVLAANDRHNNGTHAEYAVVPATQASRIPAALTDVEAAAIGNSGATAWIALAETAQVANGNRVLVHAGAGGVGGLAVQLARHFGAEVLATCSTRNLEYVRSLGAHRVIDYTREDFVRAAGLCDIVFDTLGGEVHRRSFEVLKPGGLLVRISAEPVDSTPARADVRVVHAHICATGGRFERLLDLAVRGAIKPQIGRVWPFEQVPQAYEASRSGHSRGKNVIAIAAMR